MSGRQGGKLKPLKVGVPKSYSHVLTTCLQTLQAPKKDKKEEDEEDRLFKERKKQEEAALKAAKDKGMWYWFEVLLISLLNTRRSSQR
jgi:hypothetical protein